MFSLISGFDSSELYGTPYTATPHCSCNFGANATCNFGSSCSFSGGGQCSFNNTGSTCSPTS